MSLQIWLPMNNDSWVNQGLSFDSIKNVGVTTNANGKMGTCGYFDGNSYLSTPFPVQSESTQEFSICCWVKFGNDIAHETICSSRSNKTGGISVFKLGNLSLRFDCGDSWVTSYQAPVGEWLHVCVVRSSSGRWLYINGECVDSTTNAGSFESLAPSLYIGESNKYYSGIVGNPLNGYMNDFRFYNHTLSAKEVKILSQGLAMHYPMNQKCRITNFLKDGSFSKYTTRGITALNEDLWPNTNYWSSYNHGITNPATNYHAHTDIDTFGYPVIEFNESNGLKQWKAISQRITQSVFSDNPIKLSIDVYSTGLRQRMFGGVYYTKDGKTGFHSGHFNADQILYAPINTWTRLTFDVPYNNDADENATTFVFYIYGYGFSTNSILYIKNACLSESGTTFVPHESDDDAWETDIEYDTSGQLNNANTSTPPPKFSDNSPRYDGCYDFFNEVSLDTPFPQLNDELTVSFWMKRNNNTGTRQIMASWWKGVSCELRSDNMAIFTINNASNTQVVVTSKTAITKELGWVFFTGTFSSANGCKLYLNGELEAEATSYSYKAISYGITSSKIGRFGSIFFDGCLSDFRVYATALSQDDIKDLYRTSASLADDGTLLLSGEINET